MWLYHSWNRSVVLLLWLVAVAISIALAVLKRLGRLYHGRLVRGHGLGGGGDFIVGLLYDKNTTLVLFKHNPGSRTHLNVCSVNHLYELTTLEGEPKIFVILQQSGI